jgi:hypothetical protein
MGAHVRCTSTKKLVSSDFAKILKVATKIRETCEKTLFTPPGPIKATNSIVSVQAIRGRQNCQHKLAIGCRKIASEHLAIRHSQITSNYLAILDRQIAIAYLAIKEHKNCRIYLAIISSRSPVIISNIRKPNS